jgi:hypothetical protein
MPAGLVAWLDLIPVVTLVPIGSEKGGFASEYAFPI